MLLFFPLPGKQVELFCIMPGKKKYSVYIVTNYERTVFYIGITNNLKRRIKEHRLHRNEYAFTSRYKCYFLVYHEEFSDVRLAIAREKQLKNWQRQWKIELIRKVNPDLRDLAKDW
ncbi:MAG: GIY-YIG nuclease family protein [Chitinophagaceae bacterium]